MFWIRNRSPIPEWSEESRVWWDGRLANGITEKKIAEMILREMLGGEKLEKFGSPFSACNLKSLPAEKMEPNK
jgi:hypothetical protein